MDFDDEGSVEADEEGIDNVDVDLADEDTFEAVVLRRVPSLAAVVEIEGIGLDGRRVGVGVEDEDEAREDSDV